MGKFKHEEEHAGNHERWLLTYSDLITLLMIFFVLMYTISNVDKQKLAQVAASLSDALVGEKSGKILGDSLGPSVIKGQGQGKDTEEKAMAKARDALNQLIKAAKLEAKVSVHEEERGLVISIKEPMLFESGSAVISNQYKNVLAKLGSLISGFDNPIRVEGHTDNVPIKTSQFPSNWELSTARATNVVQFLIGVVKIHPERLSAVGFGEYRNIFPNDTPAHRGQNRRVDIVLMRSEFNNLEPEGTKIAGKKISAPGFVQNETKVEAKKSEQ